VTTQRNEYILEEFKIREPADEKLRRYKSNWLRHATELTAAGWQKKRLIVDQMEEEDLEDI